MGSHGPDRPTWFEDLRPELVEPLKRTRKIVMDYLMAVHVVQASLQRDPEFNQNHFLAHLRYDLTEASLALLTLSMEGMQRPVRRELRFILEASAKLCLVQQSAYETTIEQKLEQFREQLRSPSITEGKRSPLPLLPNDLHAGFIEEVGRLYGAASDYVHWTPVQIQARRTAVEQGRPLGFETAAEVEELNLLVSRVLAVSLVFVMNSAPYWVAGHFFVALDDLPQGAWHFSRSRFLSAIDTSFDYKAERKDILPRLHAERAALGKF